jgi:hypothetical protein
VSARESAAIEACDALPDAIVAATQCTAQSLRRHRAEEDREAQQDHELDERRAALVDSLAAMQQT